MPEHITPVRTRILARIHHRVGWIVVYMPRWLARWIEEPLYRAWEAERGGR